MALLRRLHRTDRDVEKRLVTGLIISDKVLTTLSPYLSPDILELDVSKIIIRWILAYFSKYKSAPKKHIQDIFQAEKSSLKQGLEEETAGFLSTLSQEYLEDDSGVNEDYLIDQGKKYLKERYLRKAASDINAYLDIGKIDEAEKFFEDRKKLIREVTYKWVKPLDDPFFINSVFEELDFPLLRLRGHLGDIMGDLYRGWLLLLMGPMKRGKTWGLQDIAFDSLLSRKRVAYISLEMKDRHLAPRMYKQIGGFGDEEKDYIFPCFDCCNNQDNSCNKSLRENKEICPQEYDSLKPSKYKPCTACRKLPLESKEFLATTWYFTAPQPKLTLNNVRKSVNRFTKMFGRDKLRLISFPAFSATMKDVQDHLDNLEDTEGFIPDIIVTDYGGIMAPEHFYGDPRHNLDDIFKAHKRMAGERSALVVSGVQSLGVGRSALNKDMQDERDIGGNAYILAHVDVLISLDQTVDEKEKGVWRWGILEHRWKKFNKRRQVMILQQLELGMPVLDTEIIYYSGKVGSVDE